MLQGLTQAPPGPWPVRSCSSQPDWLQGLYSALCAGTGTCLCLLGALGGWALSDIKIQPQQRQ